MVKFAKQLEILNKGEAGSLKARRRAAGGCCSTPRLGASGRQGRAGHPSCRLAGRSSSLLAAAGATRPPTTTPMVPCAARSLPIGFLLSPAAAG